MKQFWVGVAVLAVLLAAGLGVTVVMDRCLSSISEDMTGSAAMALEEDWIAADTLAKNAREKWEQRQHLVAALADHSLLEAADSLFAELAVYRKQELPTEYAAVCLCLARQAEAIGESHSLRWWHVL